jgi:Tfp pilus assembly major pilin PilA
MVPLFKKTIKKAGIGSATGTQTPQNQIIETELFRQH